MPDRHAQGSLRLGEGAGPAGEPRTVVTPPSSIRGKAAGGGCRDLRAARGGWAVCVLCREVAAGAGQTRR
eukprot:COSAG01_NODE_3192_length_6435_cov_14.950284_4_plen_70_part_00